MFYKKTNEKSSELLIKTLDGNHHVSVGDYIIKGIEGELYPCKKDIFEKTYDIVNDEKDNQINNHILIERYKDDKNGAKEKFYIDGIEICGLKYYNIYHESGYIPYIEIQFYNDNYEIVNIVRKDD